MTIKRLLILGLILIALVSTVPAQASGPMRTVFNTCTEINCNARAVGGSVLTFPPFAYPWNAEFAANFGNCVRFDVIEQAKDLELIVISPDGTIYQNDDKGLSYGYACPLCPLVEIASAPMTGWYTVRVARSNGGAVNASFTMLVSQYNKGNPNCGAASSALIDPDPQKEAAKAAKDEK